MIVAGDIGGTNARFGRYENGERVAVAELSTVEFASAGALLNAAFDAFDRAPVDACCLAIAGPVLGDEARLTNVDMAFSHCAVAKASGAGRVALVNDLVALGAAIAAAPPDRFERLSGNAGAAGAKGVLAAGTGLGMAILVDGRCLASEGGHARVAPSGAFERELLAATEAEAGGGAVAWEHYLSGRGVKTLYRAVCSVWGHAPAPLEAAEIVRRGARDSDPVCHTTIETLAGMLATASGGLAVTALTLGGIYIGGTVPVAIAEALRRPSFRRRFEEAAWAADFLRDVPLYLVADPLAGLDGAHIIAGNAAAAA